MADCSRCLSKEVCRYNDGHNLYCKEGHICPHFKNEAFDWISMEERPPSRNGDYLCFYETKLSKGIRIHSFAKNLSKIDKYDFQGETRRGWYSYDREFGYYEIEDITHWIPLPKDPIERRSIDE